MKTSSSSSDFVIFRGVLMDGLATPRCSKGPGISTLVTESDENGELTNRERPSTQRDRGIEGCDCAPPRTLTNGPCRGFFYFPSNASLRCIALLEKWTMDISDDWDIHPVLPLS